MKNLPISMRAVLLILVTVLISGSNSISAEEVNSQKLPDLVSPDHPAYLHGELIYPLKNRPTPECHASTLVETPTGIVAAWFAGTEEGHTDVAIRVAHWDGKKWSKSIEVADGSEGEEKEFPCWNPVLFQPKSGPLLLFYKVGPSPRMWWGALMSSTDGGKSWKKHGRLGTNQLLGEPNTNLIGPVRSKPIQLPDGTILCPSSSEHDEWRVHFEMTRDLGKTWEVIPPINDGSQFSAIQPTILTLGSNNYQILCRTRENVLASSETTDGGRTWSKLKSSGIPNPSAGADVVTLKSGKHLLIYNHSTRSGGKNGRQILNLALSSDGNDWKPVMTLEKHNNAAGYSYPALIQTSDGKVHITYTWRRIAIKHVIVDPDHL